MRSSTTWKPDAEDIHEVYAVDRFGRLAGMIGMRQLLMQEPSAVLIVFAARVRPDAEPKGQVLGLSWQADIESPE